MKKSTPDLSSFAVGAPGGPAASIEPACDASAPGGQVRGLFQADADAVDPKNPDAAVILADWLIARALALRASDIHLHPRARDLLVRFRVDGRLLIAALVPSALGDPLVTRLKVMARLVVYQRTSPQDGRIDWRTETASRTLLEKLGLEQTAESSGSGSLATALRASFLPTLHGEDVVIRLPESAAAPLELAGLGMSGPTIERVRGLLALEQGTILLTGPSSSGKTTTIYAMLREIHALRGDAAHVLTIEDPIEQDLPFAGQVTVRADQGLGWTAALRSVLRQDPNVILIGEIRDRETAEIAIQAGMTGHLVISTIHSGRAAGVLVRLIHMNVEPFLVASSVTAVLAERLARRACPSCRKPAPPDALPEIVERLKKTIPANAAAGSSGGSLSEGGAHKNSGGAPGFVTAPGCAQCAGTGSRGRTGLFELLAVTPEIRELVLARATEAALQQKAYPGGGDALLSDALAQAAQGYISIEELARLSAALHIRDSGGADLNSVVEAQPRQ